MKDWKGNKNSVFKTLGASNHTEKERQQEDFYATDPIAIDKLLKVVTPNHQIWEPACGTGCLSKRLEEKGFDVYSSDLIDRGYGHANEDFFFSQPPFEGTFDILTNPPYAYALDFVLRALQLIPEAGHVFMFVKTTFLEGKKRRELLYNICPPRYILQFSERVLCAKNAEFQQMIDGGGSAVAYAWHVYQKHNKDKISEVKWI